MHWQRQWCLSVAESLLNCCKCLFPNSQFCMKERTTLFRCAQKVSTDKTFGWWHPGGTLNARPDLWPIQKIGDHFLVLVSLLSRTCAPEFAFSFTREPPIMPCCWTRGNFVPSSQALGTSTSPQSSNSCDLVTASTPVFYSNPGMRHDWLALTLVSATPAQTRPICLLDCRCEHIKLKGNVTLILIKPTVNKLSVFYDNFSFQSYRRQDLDM